MEPVVLRPPVDALYTDAIKKRSLIARFITWCESQEQHRFGWVAGIIIGHGCIITPLTLLAVILAGNSFLLYAMVMASMAMSLVTNLAGLSTKYTIPIFFFSLLIDATILLYCITVVFSGIVI